MTYQDEDTYWHDRECINGKPRSNNRNIYTAYSKYLAEKTDHITDAKRRLAFEKCVESYEPLKVNRLPDKQEPPMSKDEIIGLVSLGFLEIEDLEKSHWNFCNFEEYKPQKLTLINAIKAVIKMYQIRKEHRNYFWQNKIESIYCLAFLLPLWDIYYVKKFCHEKTTKLEAISFYLNFIMVFLKGDKSSRMLLWLQLKDMNHILCKIVPEKKWIDNYFEDGHPFKS